MERHRYSLMMEGSFSHLLKKLFENKTKIIHSITKMSIKYVRMVLVDFLF